MLHALNACLVVLRWVAAVLAMGGAGVAAADVTPPQPALVQHLTQLSARWDVAIVRKDRAAIAANMTEDFRQIDAQGQIETKTSFVDDLMSPDLVIEPYAVEDFEVRIYGEVALLSGRTRMTGRYAGKPFSSHYRYIDVYVRQADGAWRVASVQITRVAE